MQERELRYHFLRERVHDGDLTTIRVDSKNNLANLLTKALPRTSFEYLLEKLELVVKPLVDKN